MLHPRPTFGWRCLSTGVSTALLAMVVGCASTTTHRAPVEERKPVPNGCTGARIGRSGSGQQASGGCATTRR